MTTSERERMLAEARVIARREMNKLARAVGVPPVTVARTTLERTIVIEQFPAAVHGVTEAFQRIGASAQTATETLRALTGVIRP